MANEIVTKIRELAEKSIPGMSIQLDGIVFRDILFWDTTSDSVLKFVCKTNVPALLRNFAPPSFGSFQSPTGVEEIVIPWDNIHYIGIPVEESVLKAWKAKYPEAYNYYLNMNHVEGAEVKNTINPIKKSKFVEEWENTHGNEIAKRNRTSAIMVHEEDGVNL